MQDIVIDHKIRDWVFFPIVIVMIMVTLIRHYLAISGNKVQIPKASSKTEQVDVSDKQQLMRCQNLVKHGGLLKESSFNRRKYHLCKDRTKGYLVERGERPAPEANNNGVPQMPMNSNQMMDMLKGNITMAVPMIVLFSWVRYLFSGFIVARVPFPLTQKFRQMLQSGMNMMNLNVRYVSSLSLYFLVLSSLSQLISIFLKNEEESESDLRAKESLTRRIKPAMPGMGGMMGGMGGMGSMMNPMEQMGQMKNMFGQQQNNQSVSTNQKFFQNEKENLELQQYQGFLDDAEDQLIKKYKAMLRR
ncbi:hypothetical protein ABPG72_017614 [Tetrahymena utriculariae]